MSDELSPISFDSKISSATSERSVSASPTSDLGNRTLITKAERDAVPEMRDRFTPSDELLSHGPDPSPMRDPEYARAALDKEPWFNHLRKTNSFEALRELYSRDELPGDDARERTDFVLGYTHEGGNDSNTLTPSLHFRGAKVAQPDGTTGEEYMFEDSGFQSKFQDGKVWPHSRNQVGHFLTAVDMGEHGGPLKGLYRASAVGHELTGDPVNYNYRITQLGGGAMGLASQTGAGVPSAWNGSFDQAVQAARSGDDQGVERYVQTMLAENPSSSDVKRAGNSQQDLRLTTYGWALGEMIRQGTLKSRQDVVGWLDSNIGARR